MTNVKTSFCNTNKSCNIQILNPINPCYTFYFDQVKDRNSDLTTYCSDKTPIKEGVMLK